MVRLPKLYMDQVFQNGNGEEDIYWLQNYFKDFVVDAIITTLDIGNNVDYNDNYYKSRDKENPP